MGALSILLGPARILFGSDTRSTATSNEPGRAHAPAPAHGMTTAHTERTPLIIPKRTHTSTVTDDGIPAHDSAFSAICASPGVDVSSSTGLPPGSDAGADAEQAQASGASSELFMIMGAMWIGTFLVAFDNAVVATVLARVGVDFAVSQTVAWLGTSYLLAQIACQPMYGRLANIFGRRAVTLCASAIFMLGAFASGMSRSFAQLCVARAVTGVGGSGLTSMSTIVTSDLVSLKARGTWQGLGSLIFAAGAALGGPIGGLLIDTHVGWRCAFFCEVSLCLVHFIVVALKLRVPAGPGSASEKLRRMDVMGALALVGALAALLAVFSLAGNADRATDPVMLVALAVLLALMALFLYIEKRVAREPFMNVSLLCRPTPGLVSLACAFIGISQFGIVFNVPLYFLTVRRTSAAMAGLHLAPNALAASACSLSSGVCMSRTGRYRRSMIIGGVLGVLGPLCMCFWDRRTTSDAVYWLTMPWGGAGFGSALTITLVALMASVPPQDMAAATGVSYLCRAIGSVLGIAVTSTVLQRVLRAGLDASSLIPSEVSNAILRDVSTLDHLTGELYEAAIHAYESAMHHVFLWVLGAAVLALACQCCISEKPLPGHASRRHPARWRENTEE